MGKRNRHMYPNLKNKLSESADWEDGFPLGLRERYNQLAESVEE
ncbi:hypothetical protein NT06LI_1277 [Listeria innocua FSL J1-023]|nr:hypothetical protein NT06LI_1277 [Listeria innocua FSL J1-023]